MADKDNNAPTQERKQVMLTLPLKNYEALQREARERGLTMTGLGVLWTEEIMARQEIADEKGRENEIRD